MKTIPHLVLYALALFALSGCLQIDTLISVRGDGSGTVREQVRLSDEAVEMIRQMQETAQAEGTQTSQPGLLDREELEARALAMGPGVKLVSAQELPDSGGFGYEAVWSFTNVNTLRVEQDAEDAMSQGGAAAEPGDAKPGATFSLEPGTPAVLHVRSTLADEGEAPAAGVAAAPPGEEQVPPEMIREMFQGMRFSIAVEVEGAIIETNASHRSGSRLTLFELDFDQLLQNPRALALLSATDAPDPLQMKDALRGLPGIKVETESDLRVAFVADAAAVASASLPETMGDAPAAAAMPVVTPSPETSAAMPVVTPSPKTSAAMPVVTTSPETAVAMPSSEQPATTTVASRSAATLPAGSIAGYSWRGIALSDLAAQRFKLVSLTDTGGVVTKGMVMTIDAHSVRLRRASMDGGGMVDLPLQSLRSASVFEQGS